MGPNTPPRQILWCSFSTFKQIHRYIAFLKKQDNAFILYDGETKEKKCLLPGHSDPQDLGRGLRLQGRRCDGPGGLAPDAVQTKRCKSVSPSKASQPAFAPVLRGPCGLQEDVELAAGGSGPAGLSLPHVEWEHPSPP